jgi:RTX calcium-binding nonapeptide repeat (4 copies)
MANITGTSGDDLLYGNGTSSDTIDGGAGSDTLDYSRSNIGQSFRYDGTIRFSPLNGRILLNRSNQFGFADIKFDSITNIEKVVGRPNKSNSISLDGLSSIGGSLASPVDVDLSKNQVVFTTTDGVVNTYSIINFNNVANTAVGFSGEQNFPDSRIVGNDSDNTFSLGSSRNVVIASKGNDTIGYNSSNGAGKNTIDYSKIGNAIKYSINSAQFSSNSPIQGTIDKGIAGKDSVSNIATIIGASSQKNTVDWSTSTGGYDVNLAANSIQNRLGGSGIILNFVDAIGGNGNDTITGANKSGKLTAGGGNDRVTGGKDKDTITGTDSTARGVGEVDTLTGGGGRDKFVLGDTNGAYYVGKGKDDYALITDFNLFQDLIDLGGFKNYSFASGGNNTIDLYSGKDVNTRDLIAKIQLTGGISARNSNSRSLMGANLSTNEIISKIDILSGS